MSNQPAKTKEEQLAEARELLEVWSRKDERINRLVWNHIDNNIAALKRSAYEAGKYEAFAWLDKLEENIQVREVKTLQNSIVIMTSPEPTGGRKW